MIRLLLVFLLALSITGCASVSLTPEDEKRIHNVAIITLVPEQANFVKIGLTVFNNEKAEIEMDGRIESTILSTVKERLTAVRPQWTIKDIAYDRNLLIERINGSGMVMTYGEERIEKELAELASANQLDALLVVSGQEYETIAANGVGIWLRTLNTSSIRTALVHSNVDIKFIGPKGTVIAAGFGPPADPKPIDPAAFGINYQMKDNMRPELLDRLRHEIVEHLRKAVNKRLDQLKLN